MSAIAEAQDLATSVANAIAEWKKQYPDAIAMDVVVRLQDGVVAAEVCRKESNARAACQEAPIRYITN